MTLRTASSDPSWRGAKAILRQPLAALIFSVLGAAATIGPAHAEQYTSVKPLLAAAIDAPDGTANGVLTGPIAEKMHQTTQSRDPIQVEVTTLKEFRQEGCKRLNVRLIQPNALTKNGGRADFRVDYGINYCRDGNPPVEGMDLGAVSRAMQQPSRNEK